VVKRAGVLLGPKEFPCDFLWSYMKDFLYSVPTDVFWLVRRQLNARSVTFYFLNNNNRGILERVEENNFVSAFSIVLTITTVTLNTSCND
jgi:hypothetical protein